MSGYTKGPWKVVEGLKSNETRIWAEDAPCSRIAVVFHRCILDTRSGRGRAGSTLPYEANARLIAAVPALLRAAKRVTFYLDVGQAVGKNDPLISDLRAAIAQAEGE